jgi:hypothetical protein
VVADDLRRAIEARQYGEEGRLPSEPELARRLGVSRATVRQAMTELVEGGFVRRRQGRGTFVTDHATSLRNNLNVNSGVTDLIASAGWTPGTVDVAQETRAPSRDERTALGLAGNEEVVVVRRTRLADGRPVVAVEDALSAAMLARVGMSPTTASPTSGPPGRALRWPAASACAPAPWSSSSSRSTSPPTTSPCCCHASTTARTSSSSASTAEVPEAVTDRRGSTPHQIRPRGRCFAFNARPRSRNGDQPSWEEDQ